MKQFLDYSNNTANDTGANDATSIQPIADGNPANATNLGRPDESLRQRTEAVRNADNDTLFLRDSDRHLILSGPGKITWPGSTTASASGIPVVTDTLYLLPMLTPGFAQSAPVPPVASAFGKIHLKRASDSMNSIAVSSLRRSYAAGDQINIVVSSGAVFSCTLLADSTYQRTIVIVATGATTLSTTITALNALTPSAPDNTALVNAVLEGGALGSDLLLTVQAKQYMSGNYDGEGHAITPANLAAFFTANPTSALAEGDTLGIWFDMVSDTASTGGRRQALPENANTAVPVGSFFNSRVNPEKIANALPICKVVNGSLVFSTGIEVPAGETAASLSSVNTLSSLIRNGSFEHGITNDTTRYGISDWENRVDLAVLGAWRAGTTAVATGLKSLEFNKTSAAASTARIEQQQELPVTVGQIIKVSAAVRQLIAPTAGTYSIVLYWGDASSAASGSSSVALQVLATTDGSFRTVAQSIAVPAGKLFLKSVTVEVAGVTTGSTGVALAVDNVEVLVENSSTTGIAVANNVRVKPMVVDAVIIEDELAGYSLGQLAALLRFDRTAPSGEGTTYLERKDQTYDSSHLPPALALFGRVMQLGSKLLAAATDARSKARVGAPYTTDFDATLLWESTKVGASAGCGFRMYMLGGSAGSFLMTYNASLTAINQWEKDVPGTAAFMTLMSAHGIETYHQQDTNNSPWATWPAISKSTGSVGVHIAGNPQFTPMLEFYDDNSSRRVAIDHLGLRGGRYNEFFQTWLGTPVAALINGWTIDKTAGGVATTSFSDAGQHLVGPHAQLFVNATNDTSFFQSPGVFSFADLFNNGAFCTHVLEFEMDAGALSSGVRQLSFQIGWIRDKGVNAMDGVYISKTAASLNYQFITRNNSTAQQTDTGIVPTSSGVDRFRIELYGDNTPSSAHALCYINGALVAENATTIPSTDDSFIAGWFKSTGLGGQSMYISPIRYAMARVDSDDRL